MNAIDHTSIREELRAFVRDHGRIGPGEDVDDATPLFADRVLTSLQVPELLLLIESARGAEIDVLALEPGDLDDIDTIVERFFR